MKNRTDRFRQISTSEKYREIITLIEKAPSKITVIKGINTVKSGGELPSEMTETAPSRVTDKEIKRERKIKDSVCTHTNLHFESRELSALSELSELTKSR